MNFFYVECKHKLPAVIQFEWFSENRWQNVGHVSSAMSGSQVTDLGKNIGRVLETCSPTWKTFENSLFKEKKLKNWHKRKFLFNFKKYFVKFFKFKERTAKAFTLIIKYSMKHKKDFYY